MKKFNDQPPSTSPTRSDLSPPIKGSEIKYVRTQSYLSTSRNLVEQVASVSSQTSDKEFSTRAKTREYKGSSGMGRKPSMRDRSLKRQPSFASGEKKTRWLLTRKTWRYMADAGRKLIPDNVQNKPENIEKIEEHFQKLCQNEKKFLIWRRKLSYPGASGSFRRKNKNKVSKRPMTLGSPPTGSSADEFDDDRPRGKGTDDLIIKMLEKYLSINSDVEESESEQQKTQSPPPAREINNNNNSSKSDAASSRPSTDAASSRPSTDAAYSRPSTDAAYSRPSTDAAYSRPSTSGMSKIAQRMSERKAESRSNQRSSFGASSSNPQSPTSPLGAFDAFDTTKSNVQDHSIWHLVPGNESIHSSLLLDSLKQYRKKNFSPYLESDEISSNLLKDKILLRKILNDIKTQQKYSKTIPRTESTRSLNISYSSSMSSLTSTISSTFHNFVDFIDTKKNRIRDRGSGDASMGVSSSSGKDFRYRSGDSDYNSGQQFMSSFAVSSSPSSRSVNTSSMYTKPHQIYSQQKQIFANQQQQQLYLQQQQYPSLRSNRTSQTTLKTITKTTSTTTVSSSRQPPDTTSPTSPTYPPGILKNVSRKHVKTFSDGGTQTEGIPLPTLNEMFTEYKKQMEIERQEEEDSQPDGGKGKRKSSIDNKDVSQSVSDTIKRYLNMARKKPKDKDAANRFKSVNYDRNLRNIKAKGEITKPGDDDGLMKGCQTDRDWLEVLFLNPEELNRCCTTYVSYPEPKSPTSTSPSPSIPSSPPSPSTGLIQSSTQFLSNLFTHNNQSNSPTSPTQKASPKSATDMQKSKSSSNVRTNLMSKKIFRSRSKSQTRTQAGQTLVPSSSDIKPQWTPQGNGVWGTNNGKRVQLRDVFLPSLTEVERVLLEKQAQDKILQLGITLSPQEAAQTTQKPHKRRVLLLKRKAVTTGIFDGKGKDDSSYKGGGLVFGLSLEQCIENDNNRSKGKKETRSSRSSLSSLLDLHTSHNNSGSCESLPAKHDAEYLHNTFSPLYHTNIDRRSSHDDDENPSNIAGVHSQVQQVPSIVLACTKYLEENGLSTIGIFRVSTSKKRVRQLREDFDKEGVTTFEPDVCSHDIATLLKEFFRDLPEPLLCRHLYKAFLQTQSIRNRRLQLEGVSHMIRLLPVAHRDTLYVLLKFLAKVARAANDTKSFDGQVISNGNKMDSTNLATIIAPNILHCIKSDQMEEQELVERSDVINIIRIMIDHFEDLFIVNTEDMNEIYTTMMDVYPLQLDYLLDRLHIRQEDDIDSGSSIPPLSPPYNPQHHTTFSDEEKTFSPTSSVTTISTVGMPKKVIYSREDILHENAGKGGTQSARRIKDRDIRLRMKYQDPEKPLRRRRQSDRTESGDLSSSSSTHESYQHSSGISVGGDRDYYIHTISSNDANKTRSSSIDSNASDVFEAVTRRMSSPLQSAHSAGVVTASLKIPVQSSASNVQNIQFFVHEKAGHNIGDHIVDIPFIEDNNSSFDFSDEVLRNNVPTTVYPQRPQSVTVTSKRLDEVQKVNAPQDPKHSTKTTLSIKDHISSTSAVPSSSSQKQKIEPQRKSSLAKVQMSSSTGHISLGISSTGAPSVKTVRESNYTPSISSIGSVLLRSKTADFEKILSDKNKKSRISAMSPSQHPPKAVETTASQKSQPQPNPLTSRNVIPKAAPVKKEPEQKLPIYKRQEIISSVQKTVKK